VCGPEAGVPQSSFQNVQANSADRRRGGWWRLSLARSQGPSSIRTSRRWYAWTQVELAADGTPTGWGRRLLIRRSLSTGELAFYRCAGPADLPLAALVKVAGCRWRIEESFQATKGLCGLDEHQVRRWTSWYRWATLAMLAYAFLAVAAATERDRHPPPPGGIALTCSEIQHLFAARWYDRSVIGGTGCAGRGGAAGIKPALAPVTIGGKPRSNHEHHEVRLEY
jgi:hypothetical protein